jgi:hypothetical protein
MDIDKGGKRLALYEVVRKYIDNDNLVMSS